MGIKIGTIIRSESHIIYWAQVENSMESSPKPKSIDCAFGTFVKVSPQQEKDMLLIGLIIDTLLIDRDALRAGPRLAQDFNASKIAYPDFIDERIKLVKVLLIGYIDENKQNYHFFPDVAPHLNDPVQKMDVKEIKSFHILNGSYKLGYYSAAIGAPSNLVKPLFLRILPRLMEFFPDEQKPILQLLKNNLEFKMKLEGDFI